MEKHLIKNKEDLNKIIRRFESEWKSEIRQEVSDYPCVLVSCFSIDVEYGGNYQFTAVKVQDFHKSQDL